MVLPSRYSALIDPSFPKDGDLYIRSVRFSPDGEFLATGAEDQQVRVRLIPSLNILYIYVPYPHPLDNHSRFGTLNNERCVTYLQVTQTKSMLSITLKTETSSSQVQLTAQHGSGI